MAQEYEAKILNIDVADLEQKFHTIGATKKSEHLFRSKSFDYQGFPLDRDSSWVRLRDDGTKVTLAYKKRLGVGNVHGRDGGMEEIEIIVDNYEKTAEFLLKIGLIVKFEQEKKRIHWEKDGVDFDIDYWPKLNPYLEVEAKSWKEVDEAVLGLGFNLEDKVICSATQIYEMNGIRDKDYISMTFGEWVRR
jgi:adenylate cyclase class IV